VEIITLKPIKSNNLKSNNSESKLQRHKTGISLSDIPVAVVQHTFTHKQYTEYEEQNIHNNKKLSIHNNKKINQFGKCGPCPVFASYTLAFSLQLRNRNRKTSVITHKEFSTARMKELHHPFHCS
jgi:hypothetical protein